MISKRFALFILLILSLVSLSFAQAQVQEGEVVETILDNGLKVLTVEIHNAPIVYSQLSYKVGSRNENVGSTGIAHITEHMMFKGTPNYPAGTISQIIKNNAGVFNAFTSNDITAYYEQMPKNKIEQALAIESDRMYNCVIDSGELARELNVIMEERRMRTENNPRGLFSEEFNAIAFKSSPYHWPVVGWMDDIKNTTRDEVYNFYRTYYTPNNATLVLVGDFETGKMLQTVEDHFGKIPRGPEVDQTVTSEIEQLSTRTVTLKRPDVKTVTLQMGWHTPGIGHPDNAALYFLARILGGGKTSRLRKNLVEEKKLAIRVSARATFGKDPYLFIVSAELRKEKMGQLGRVKDIIFDEIEKIKAESVSEYELQKVKNRIAFNEVSENLKVSGIGGRLSRYETYLSWKFYDDWKKQRQAVTVADVKRAANQYLHAEYLTIGYLLPSEKAEKITKKSSSIHKNNDQSNFFYQNPTPKKKNTNLQTEQKLDVAKPNPIAPRVKKAKLNNGIEVYFIRSKAFPIFSLHGFIRTGNCPEDAKKPGLGSLTGRMMNRGTKQFSFDYLSERMDFIPFSFNVSGGVETIDFGGSVLSEYADTLLFYAMNILTEPAFPENGLEIVRASMITSLRRAEGSAGWKTSRFLFERIYGKSHPYGRLSTGGEKSLRQITIADLKNFHKKYYCPQHTMLFVLSDLSMDKVLEKLNRSFGKWRHANPPQLADFPNPTGVKGRVVKVFPMPEKKQADVRIGGLLVPYGHKDSEAIELAVHILGGSSLTSRMGVNIREKQALAYHVGVKTRQRQHGGLWFMQSGTKPETATQLLKSALAEIRRMRREKVSDAELLNAKRFLIGILPMMLESPDDVLRQVEDTAEHHLPVEYFDNYADRIMAVTKDDILRVMTKYFDTKNIVIVGAGPMDEHEFDIFKDKL
ncbi:MAG: insulinase family protein [Calditrichaeota bacterium]|nr:insulinase family protein [Calditrichota bacterium]